MKIIIPFNSEENIYVSDEDYEYLNQWSWQLTHNKCVLRRDSLVYMSWMILDRQGILHPDEVDHKDRNSLNNQRDNLRPATKSQNMMNRGIQSNNIHGYKGVYFMKQHNKFAARITVNKERMHLGLFKNDEDAARAYDKAAKIYHKEFAVLNFPNE